MWKTRTLGKGMSKWKRTDTRKKEREHCGITVQHLPSHTPSEGTGHQRHRWKQLHLAVRECICWSGGGLVLQHVPASSQMSFDTAYGRSHSTLAFCFCGKVGHLRAVCRNTNTHEIEKDADEPSPEDTVEEACCMAVHDTAEVDHCNIVSSQNSKNSQNIVPSQKNQKSQKSHHEHRDGSKFGKVVTKIETDEQDRNRRQKTGHE